MKNPIMLALIVLLFSCTKPLGFKSVKEPVQLETCYQNVKLSAVKREQDLTEPTGRKVFKGKLTQPSTPPTGASVMYLNFNADTVSGTNWNVYGDPLYISSSGLTDAEIQTIFTRIKEAYDTFNVVVTTDRSVYYSYPVTKRQRLDFTESFEFFCGSTPCVGGTSHKNSLTFSSDDPAFVFTSALGYNIHNIAEAGAHELGHTVGLSHQAVWDSSCNLVSQYNSGNGITAPIMGVSYYVNKGMWWVGPTNLSCTTIQDDRLKISSVLGYK